MSVVIPAYNRADLLPRALESVRRQQVQPSEVLVVDDGSTDGTAAVAERLGARVLVLPENAGASAARAHGVQAATQPWIALLDSDDEWLPWMLSTLWPQRHGHALVAGASIWVQDGNVTRYEGLPVGQAARLTKPDILVWPQNFIPAAGVLVRRDAMLVAMRRDEDYRYSEDFATWLRILDDHAALVVARPVVRYHVHAGQKTASSDRLRDQHAIVRARVREGAVSVQQLRRRIQLDSWDEADVARLGRARRLLHPRRAAAIVGALLWRRFQAGRHARFQ